MTQLTIRPAWRWSIVWLAGIVLVGTAALTAPAAETAHSAWESLPPETVLMLRIPAGNDFLATLRKQTKAGSVLFSQDRLDKLAAAIRDQGPPQGQANQLATQLAQYNLKVEDWHSLFAGEAGYALALLPRTEQPPLAVGLTWFEPSGDLGDRLIKAMQTSFEEHKGQAGWPNVKDDSEIAGHQITRFTMNQMGPETPSAPGPQTPGADAPPAQAPAPQSQPAAGKQIQIDQTHMWVTRIGNRILFANTYPQSETWVRNLLATPGAKVDFAAISGLQAATDLFARFLAAQTGTGKAPNVPAALCATPGLAQTMPAGQIAFEMMGDLRPLLKLANNDANADAARALKALGLDTMGPAAFRVTLDGNLIRYGGFLSVPAPRTGLMALLDQEPMTPQPPPWVPTQAISYMAMSFDLGKAYARIKDLVLAQNPQYAANFQMAEGTVAMQFQVDLPTLLSSLGHEHQILQLLPQVKAASAPAGGAPPAPGAGLHAQAKSAPTTLPRIAVVLNLTDPAPPKKVFDVLGAMGVMGAPLQEPGFTGFRTVQSGMEAAFLLGDKNLVMTFGPGMAESATGWLHDPPQGNDALATSPIYQRAKGLITLEPCQFYFIFDANRCALMYRDVVRDWVDQGAVMAEQQLAHQDAPPDTQPSDDARVAAPGTIHDPKVIAAQIKAMLPSDAELDGTFGAGVNQAIVKEPGLVYQGAIEVPPPGK